MKERTKGSATFPTTSFLLVLSDDERIVLFSSYNALSVSLLVLILSDLCFHYFHAYSCFHFNSYSDLCLPRHHRHVRVGWGVMVPGSGD
ncbi:hypothetical protein E2C01_012355 [Portunus trituberculatus]|uniref:Transmembrane protein n=1 Tax=Portunus trituberculatus TaxID=210409 RepID=A0A5B7DDH7_PORTR|nr:hypothetical protein [Portunus trituberculatus]